LGLTVLVARACASRRSLTGARHHGFDVGKDGGKRLQVGNDHDFIAP